MKKAAILLVVSAYLISVIGVTATGSWWALFEAGNHYFIHSGCIES